MVKDYYDAPPFFLQFKTFESMPNVNESEKNFWDNNTKIHAYEDLYLLVTKIVVKIFKLHLIGVFYSI